jgi:hypothetical protein
MTASGGCGPPGMVSERHRRAHAGGGVCGCEIFITARPLSLQPPDALTISGCNYSMVTARLDVRLLGVGVGLQARSRLEQLGRTITRPPSVTAPHSDTEAALLQGIPARPGQLETGGVNRRYGTGREVHRGRCAVVLAGIRGRSRAATAYLFLPLVWPHGPIGHLGGPAPGVPRQWPILGAGPPRTT